MRTLLFAVVLCLLASVVLSDKIWDYCGSETDTLQLKDIQVSPDQPVAGETFKVEIIGTLKSPIADGKAHVLAMFAGVKLFEGDVGICQAGLTCPIGTGPFDVAISQKIPEFAPIGGPYTGKIIMTDQTGAQITCITFKFDMQEPENKAKAMINDQAFIDEVNTKATTWQAGSNKIFDGKSVQDLQKFLGARLTNTIPSKPLKTLSNDSALPESFDSRIQWKDCVHPVRDQQRCGSCWAFAASEALSDRFCIKSKSAINLVLSPQYMVSCDKSDFGCNGGYLENAWQFLQDTGIPTEKCYPYTSGEGDSGVCKTTCADGSALKLYKTKDTNTFEGEEAIMNEIYSNGPVEAGFLVYRDFMNYKSGVYQHASGGILGGHAVKILGWGVDSLTKTNYWIIANSWGTSWGMNGFFFMKRGTNECGIEGNVVAGTPDV